jgi:hypothetical protein
MEPEPEREFKSQERLDRETDAYKGVRIIDNASAPVKFVLILLALFVLAGIIVTIVYAAQAPGTPPPPGSDGPNVPVAPTKKNGQ